MSTKRPFRSRQVNQPGSWCSAQEIPAAPSWPKLSSTTWGKAAIMHAVQEAISPEKCIPAPSPPYNDMDFDPGQSRNKAWDDMTNTVFDLIVTICDQAAGEPSPNFPGQPRKRQGEHSHPAKATGTTSGMNAEFNQAFYLIKEHIENLLPNH